MKIKLIQDDTIHLTGHAIRMPGNVPFDVEDEEGQRFIDAGLAVAVVDEVPANEGGFVIEDPEVAAALLSEEPIDLSVSPDAIAQPSRHKRGQPAETEAPVAEPPAPEQPPTEG